jgi:uncharacterized protein YidB (DUF937 family)
VGLLFKMLRGRPRGLSLLAGLLTSGLAGALIHAAIQHVLDQSRHRRHSWPVAPDDVEKALGYERMQWLERKTGLSRAELMAGLRFSSDAVAERAVRRL